MKRLRYIGKTLKQDETEQKKFKICSLRNRVKRNETMKHSSFFFIYKPISVS